MSAEFECDRADNGYGRGEVVLRRGLLLIAAAGLTTLAGYNPLPAAVLIDFLLAFVLAVSAIHPTARSTTLALAATAYVSVKFCYFAMNSEPATAFDLVQAYKAYLFLPVVALYAGQPIFTTVGLSRLVRPLIVLFVAKYAIAEVVHAASILGDRPGLFDENNFELPALFGIFYFAFPAIDKKRLWVAAVFATTVLSGSRSGIVEFTLLLFFLKGRTVGKPRPVLFLSALGASVAATWYLFHERVPGVSQSGLLARTDRYHFLQIYLQQVQADPWWHALIGAPPLTPLSDASCQQLVYYSRLFSSAGNGVCYSVVLHSFMLRALFDQGIIGFAFLMVLLWCLMREGGATRGDASFVLLLGLANGLSVSAFNNEFMLIAVVIAASMRGPRRPGDQDGRPHPQVASAKRGTMLRGLRDTSTSATRPSERRPTPTLPARPR